MYYCYHIAKHSESILVALPPDNNNLFKNYSFKNESFVQLMTLMKKAKVIF